MCNKAVEIDTCFLAFVSDHLKTQEMCDKGWVWQVCKRSNILEYAPDHFKTQEMCDKALALDPWQLRYVPDHFKTQAICIKVIGVNQFEVLFAPNHIKTQQMWNEVVVQFSYTLRHVPDHFKTEEMCKQAVCNNPYTLNYVPDWFVTQEQVKIWRGDDYYCDNNTVIEWSNGYQKCKAQKVKVKEQLLLIKKMLKFGQKEVIVKDLYGKRQITDIFAIDWFFDV